MSHRYPEPTCTCGVIGCLSCYRQRERADLASATNDQLAARLRRAADRVAKRADLAALLNEAAERLTGEPF